MSIQTLVMAAVCESVGPHGKSVGQTGHVVAQYIGFMQPANWADAPGTHRKSSERRHGSRQRGTVSNSQRQRLQYLSPWSVSISVR